MNMNIPLTWRIYYIYFKYVPKVINIVPLKRHLKKLLVEFLRFKQWLSTDK